jgi:hypothetical protein
MFSGLVLICDVGRLLVKKLVCVEWPGGRIATTLSTEWMYLKV